MQNTFNYAKYKLYFRNFIIILSLQCSLLGCKKENAVIEPEVTLFTSYTGKTFNVFDTVPVKAIIHHHTEILNISISITDQDLNPLVAGPVFNPDVRDYEIDSYLVINNKYITETSKFLLIEVEDNNQVFNFWFDINIRSLDKELLNLLIVTGHGNNNELNNLLPDGNFEKIYNWNSEYLGGYVDSRFEMFYTSGSSLAGVIGLNLKNHEVLWNVPTQPNGSIPYYTAFDGSDGLITVGRYDGYIQTYNQYGLILMKSMKQENGTIFSVKNFKNYVLAVNKTYSSGLDKLIVLNFPSGNEYDKIDLSGNFKQFISFDERSLIIVTEEGGIYNAYIYDIPTKQLNFYNEISKDILYQSTGQDENIFFIGLEDIKWYKPKIGSTVNYIQIPQADAITFEALSKSLFVAKGSILYQYILPSTVPVATITMDDSIKDIKLFYNK